jgi:hypothetical protein
MLKMYCLLPIFEQIIELTFLVLPFFPDQPNLSQITFLSIKNLCLGFDVQRDVWRHWQWRLEVHFCRGARLCRQLAESEVQFLERNIQTLSEYIFIILGRCLYLSFSIHKQCTLSQNTKQHCYVFLKTLYPGGIRTHGLQNIFVVLTYLRMY